MIDNKQVASSDNLSYNIKMHKFGILGYGYVGKATQKGLLNDRDVVVYDTASKDTNKSDLYEADTIFICIPTNDDKDIDIIIEEIKDLQKNNPGVDIVIRSTLPLGTCKKIQDKVGLIIYIPEFLRERYWDTDCFRRPIVYGYDGGYLPKWLQHEEIYQCSTAEAELVKMFSNNFAVMRIAFANVFYDLSQSVGADYNKVKDLFFKVEHDQSYMEVPGHDGTRGFGGKCLPKDLDFLISTLDEKGIDQNWFKHIRELNKGWKEKF
jgi:UDPglucose 6-dehydrogenase